MAYQSVNPYDGKILKTFKELTDNQLETALGNEATCFENWRHTTFAGRAAVVTKAAAIMRARTDEFARPMTLEMGKLMAEARAHRPECARPECAGGQGGKPRPGQESRRADPARFGWRGRYRAGGPIGGQAHRLPGHNQSHRGWRRARHAGGPQRHFPGQRLSYRARRGGEGLRELRGLCGEVHREPAPH